MTPLKRYTLAIEPKRFCTPPQCDRISQVFFACLVGGAIVAVLAIAAWALG